MELIMIDPRALRENPNPSRRTKSSPQSDALMIATIKACGIITPPVVYATRDGGNELTVHVGSRRVRLSVAAGLAQIPALQIDPETEGGLMRELVENVAREPLNPVDLWRAIERLTAEDWTEQAIGTALALPLRQIRKLRLLANVLPAMLDQFAKGDMPSEHYLATIAAATLEEQAAVWKKHKPTKASPRVIWHMVETALSKRRMNGILRQIEARALRRVVTRRAQRRSPAPGRIPWSRDDERAYQAEIQALSFAHEVAIEALNGQLDREDRAIAIITRRQDHARIHA